MKFYKLFIYVFFGLLVFTVSCDKEADSSDPLVFSENTVEQNKQAIEDAGIALVRGISSAEKEPAINVLEALSFFLELSDPFSSGNFGGMKMAMLPGSYAFIPSYSITQMDKIGYQGVFKALAINPLTDEPETIQQVYDLLTGIYSWNSAMQMWIYEPIGNTIVFKFPSAESKSVNNASYTINYKGYIGEVVDLIKEEYDGDLPMQVSTKLKLDGEVIMNFNINIAYTDMGLPTGISSKIKLTSSEFTYSAENINNKEANMSFLFKNNNKLLLKFVLSGEGNWDKENIEDNVHYYQYVINENFEFTEIEVGADDEWEYTDFDIYNVVKGGNSLFQISNIKVEGTIDCEAIGNELVEIEDNELVADSTYWKSACDVMNENIDLSLRFVDSDEIIALVEAYPVQKTKTYYEYFYYDNWQENPMVMDEDYYEIAFRFIFGDKSTIDLEVYFGEGFEDLVLELENLILETKK